MGNIQKTGIKKIKDIDTTPFFGGCNTVLESQQIPLGGFSMVQNLRNTHPGFIQRKGQRALHTTADGSNSVMTLYQFTKNKQSESHFYAQFSDNDVLKATALPPTVTTGVFGPEVFSGSASSIPASWSNINDTLLFSNGVDQHQIYHGTNTYIDRFILYDGAAAPGNVPTLGRDYSDQVRDRLTTTVAILDSLDTYANNECIFIKSPVPINSLTITIAAGNDNASVLSGYYWNGAWTQVSSLSDGTDVAGDTLKQTGTVTWTLPTDSIPNYMYGENGYWYRLQVSVQLDAEVEISKVTFSSNWQSIENVWNGIPVDVIETQFNDDSADIFKTFGSVSIEIDEATSSDKFYIASSDRICGIYVDVGSKPNTTAGTTVNAVYYWNGTAFASVGTVSDGTNGLSNSGWITFPRQVAHKRQFNENQYYAYWYYFTVDLTLNDDVIISLLTMPYFDIADFGKGYCNAAWKNRAVYGFDKDQFLFVSQKGEPQVLNGSDYGILEPGDGRTNKPVAMAKFHNELMVWQEEKGKDGGCLTLFEGFSPATFGKLLLSSKVGTLNAKSVVVVDGVYTSTKTDETVDTIAYFLSHYGVFMSDGTYVTSISDDIQNYFDPLESECIRRGYESQMWLKYDSAYNVIRVGLVSGSSATTCNIFPVFDITTKKWTFDILEQKLTCIEEVEAGSGNVHTIQVAGGTGDGLVYQSNYGNNDVSIAITSYVDIKVNAKGREVELDDLVLLMGTSIAVDITPTVDGSAEDALSVTSVTNNRDRYSINSKGFDITLKVGNSTASEQLKLYEYGVSINTNQAR